MQSTMVFKALMILRKDVLMKIFLCRQPRYQQFSNVQDDWVLYKELAPYLSYFDKPEQKKYVVIFFLNLTLFFIFVQQVHLYLEPSSSGRRNLCSSADPKLGLPSSAIHSTTTCLLCRQSSRVDRSGEWSGMYNLDRTSSEIRRSFYVASLAINNSQI